MSDETAVNRLKYYRSCLADSDRMSLGKMLEHKGVSLNNPFSEEEISQNPTILKWFPEEKEQRRNRPNDPVQLPVIRVLLAPFRLIKAYRDNQNARPVTLFPYWVPARLRKDGRILPSERAGDIPWLIREVLSPNELLPEEYPVICTLEHSDDCATRYELLTEKEIDYWASCRVYFECLAKGALQELQLTGWTADSGHTLVIPDQPRGLIKPLLMFYDHQLSKEARQESPLLKSMLRENPRQAQVIKHLEDLWRLNGFRTRHWGQMGNRFPLSRSQRISLLICNQMEEGAVHAVNGPPGTGKTTLLQSVVAHAFVASALIGERPPLLLACSTNNQAITNILDSFQSIAPSGAMGGLAGRWLPEQKALGTYLASSDQRKLEEARARGYRVLAEGHRDDYLEYVDAYPKGICETHFLDCARSCFGDQPVEGLAEAVVLCRREVERCCEVIERCEQAIRTLLNVAHEGKRDWREMDLLVEDAQRQLEQEAMLLQDLQDMVESHHLRREEPGLATTLWDALRLGMPWKRRKELAGALGKRMSFERELPRKWSDLRPFVLDLIGRKRAKLAELKERRDQVRQAHQFLESLLLSHQDLLSELGKETGWVERVQMVLDLTLRHEAFWSALHFWEARWLQERDDQAYRGLNKGKAQREERLRTLAYLTPLMVSTFHNAGNVFGYSVRVGSDWSKKPLGGIVDLLLVDEAGQVAPEIGLPAFTLARKALVVGDTLQIEPIWGMYSRFLDLANARRCGLVGDEMDYERWLGSHQGCHNGSLMVLAQQASHFVYPPPQEEEDGLGVVPRGSMLTEHRRCVPEIISFCNKHVYGGCLDICTPTLESIRAQRQSLSLEDMALRDLPGLGYCHVPGASETRNGSRINEQEADAVAAWIAVHQRDLEKLYPGEGGIGGILGVVTPFRLQKEAIAKRLKRRGVPVAGMTIGTVHALQGAEKKIILFSPVHGANERPCTLFFDQNINMLNVAVSRAKHHFLVFGNMGIFQGRGPSCPSTYLGQMLLERPGNELSNAFYYQNCEWREQSRNIPVARISSLQGHREILREVLEQARQRVIVVSPFISTQALRADDLISLMQKVRQRGVAITIYTDEGLNCDPERMSRGERVFKPSAREGMELIRSTGARVNVRRGIHNKTLVADQSLLVEGSFNWLSAVRDTGSPLARYETSIVVRNPFAESFVKRLTDELAHGDMG